MAPSMTVSTESHTWGSYGPYGRTVGQEQQVDRGFAESIAQVARALQSEHSAQATLQKMVEMAVATIEGCDHAGVTILDGTLQTPAATDDVPRRVDAIQYATNQGPCLSAIRTHRVCVADDLATETRWPLFAARAVAETGVRSMLSFRLFLEQDTLGSLNLYSTRAAAFAAESQLVGEVFASHAALALQAAREHDLVQEMTEDLQAVRGQAKRYARQAEFAVTLQRSMLTDLPDLAPLQAAARYLPATEAAEIGGDWYDAFVLPTGTVALAVGDLAGHDLDAAVAMGQARSTLRTLAVDRCEPPGQLLARFDRVLAQLLLDRTATCVYAHLSPLDPLGRIDPTVAGGRSRQGDWQLDIASAGHLPPLLISQGAAQYLDMPEELLLGSHHSRPRTTSWLVLPAGSTLLLYTDGLIERRDRHLDDGLAELHATAVDLAAAPVDRLCDELLARLVPHPTDDVCLLAVHLPRTPEKHAADSVSS